MHDRCSPTHLEERSVGAVSRSPQERPIADRDGDRDQVDGLERVGPWPGLAANWPISS